MSAKKITIFTDGSSRGNPGRGGWAAVVVDGVAGKVRELGGAEAETTNNRMEILAAIEGLKRVAGAATEVTIYTDSSYLIKGATQWVFGWKKNGWKTAAKDDVLNRDLWEDLLGAMNAVGTNISWEYVGGHVGIAGNERCDEIATVCADGGDAHLYSGTLAEYAVKNILDVTADASLAVAKQKSSSRKSSGAKAYSYISKVDGLTMVHRSWAECEARVKGKSGARFKKSFSPSDEAEIIADFA